MNYCSILKYLLMTIYYKCFYISIWAHLARRMKSGSHSIPVKSGCLSFDGDVRELDRTVFCVGWMSSCGHHQLGFRNHYLSRTRSPNTLLQSTYSTNIWLRHTGACMNHPHLISYAFICLYKVKFVLLTYYTDQFLIHCAHIQKQDEEWKKKNRVRTEWYSQVGCGEFFSVPGHTKAFLTAGFHLDPAVLCVLYVGSCLDSALLECCVHSGFYTTFSFAGGIL